MSESVNMSESVQGNTSTHGDEVGRENVEDKQHMPRKKKKLISNVWDSFQQIEVDGNLRAVCNFCKKELCGNSKANGTSSLRYHARSCQKNPLNLSKDAQKTLLEFHSNDLLGEGERKMSVLRTWRFDQDATRKALARMVIIDELPFRFVEGEGFKLFVQVACPTFSIPSRITVARDCYQIYLDEAVKMRKFLKEASQRVCLTTDTWTSNQNINYLCLTVHFIDSHWRLHKRLLNFVPINSHKGEEIGRVIEKCLIDWGIENVFTITVDNASSNNTAVAYLKERIQRWKGCILDGKYLHMRCIAHIINLVVNDGINTVKDSISRVRKAVRYVKQSPARLQKFKECVAIEKIESKSLLCLDVCTRWNSTYMMLDAAQKFQKAFERYHDIDPFFAFDLTQEESLIGNRDYAAGLPNHFDWENVQKLSRFLKNFYNLTNRISGSKYVTSNIFFTEISEVICKIKSWQEGTDHGLVEMANKMKAKYDKYWGDITKMNMIIYIGVVLDPRFKLDYVKFTLLEVYGDEDSEDDIADKCGRNMGERVKKALYEMFGAYVKLSNPCVETREHSSVHMLDENEDDVGESSLVSRFLKHRSLAENEDNKSELDKYLDESIEKNGGFDILGWWKLNSHRYPVLSQMARDVLAVPISTVASESSFSTSGRILDAFRSSLTPRIVESLLCAQDWIRASLSQPHSIQVEEDLAEIEKLDEGNVYILLFICFLFS
uniref:BED-type domain-containing protein n=1 Tax=Kalanchoe fedtschenkoi TaxID=63787 RepID=A0A7N1A947_KALFE